MLSATRLEVMRGGRTIVAGVSLYADAGHALVIHGANGSGKSTLIAALAGLLPLSSGALAWQGVPVRANPARYRRDLAFLGHTDGISGELTVLENLRFAASLDARSVLKPDVLDAAGLTALGSLHVNRLSQGQRRRVALARVICSNKPLWLLDEPTDALDDSAAAWFTACIDAHLNTGGTVIAATHRPIESDAARTRRLHLTRSAPCCA
ncbi:heme ABC exporter ATP-binding protein CcmA [Caballeronia sp. BR00000012568055]|uniref:heme ABC exporter ATP-binding protein CcmA n=1 Tax=Caballeronia sp. BR00000012568055 TaxID=2918761 RepID=UPI0023F6C0EE|nr:heme ABC exporter ATP-binding protein CcmA [Caballeronia sp. BR00000012568055]